MNESFLPIIFCILPWSYIACFPLSVLRFYKGREKVFEMVMDEEGKCDFFS